MSEPKLILKCKGKSEVHMWDDYTYTYSPHGAHVRWKIEGDEVFISSKGSTTWTHVTHHEQFFIDAAIEADDIMRLDKEIEEFLSE